MNHNIEIFTPTDEDRLWARNAVNAIKESQAIHAYDALMQRLDALNY